MTDKDFDKRLDEALASMRADSAGDVAARRAAKRAWAGVQSEGRKAGWSLANSRGQRRFAVAATAADTGPTSSRLSRLASSRRARFAVATAAAVVLSLGVTLFAGRIAIGGDVGAIHAMEGQLVRLDGGHTEALSAGSTVTSGEALRTGPDGRAVLVLPDGTRVEMDARSEIRIDRTLRGPVLRVVRGRVLVARGDGAMRVLTADLELTGDTAAADDGSQAYTVNRGVLGTRVTVLDGSVTIGGPGGSRLVSAGDQFLSNDQLQAAPIHAEVDWSIDAELYADLVAEASAAHENLRQALEEAPLRTSSNLPDRAPTGTLIYAAFPNIAAEVIDGQMQLFERLGSDPRIAAVHGAPDAEAMARMAELLEPLRSAAEYMGGEIVLVWVDSGPQAIDTLNSGDDGSLQLVLMAEVTDEASLRRELNLVMDALNDEDEFVGWVDESADAELVMDISAGVLAVSPNTGLVADIAAGIGGLDERLRSAVDEAYGTGVAWLGVADLEQLAALTAADASDDDRQMAQEAGFLDAQFLVVEHRNDETRARLEFTGPRQGMAAWLDAPAPVGALAFVSGDAALAGAFVSQDAAEMFDDVLEILGLTGPEGTADLHELETELGISVRDDIAAAVGGEVALALDGSVAPSPSWKVVVEVIAPERLQSALEAIAADGRSEGKMRLESEQMSGRTMYRVVIADQVKAFYTYADGYLVAAPRAELVERALRYRADGFTLDRAPAFRDLLPAGDELHFSAMWYQNMEAALAPLMAAGDIAGGDMPREALDVVGRTLKPSLTLAYAGPDAVTLASRGGAGPFGVDLAGMLSGMQALSLAEGLSAAPPAGR